MEQIHTTVAQKLDDGEKYTDRHAAWLIREVTTAVDFIHRHGWAHHDIKVLSFQWHSNV